MNEKEKLIEAIQSLNWYHVNTNTGRLVYGSNDSYTSYLRYSDVIKAVNNVISQDEGAWMLKQKARMCKSFFACNGCPLYPSASDESCEEKIINHHHEAAEIIRKWAAEHPEKLTRTRQDLILEAFPNVKLVDGCINVCTYNFKRNPECRGAEGCSECMRDFWIAPAEGEDNNGLEKDHQR